MRCGRVRRMGWCLGVIASVGVVMRDSVSGQRVEAINRALESRRRAILGSPTRRVRDVMFRERHSARAYADTTLPATTPLLRTLRRLRSLQHGA